MRTVSPAPGVEFAFAWIPPGTYARGSEPGEAGRDADEGPRHEVTLTRGFLLGVHEVTQAQWTAVMGRNPAVFRRGADAPRRPVESVSWDDCQRFLAALNRRDAGRFRLPTEAEWEYAARAGTQTAYNTGVNTQTGCVNDPNLDLAGWYCGNANNTTHPVGQKRANEWGLLDMHGNVWEWVQDWYAPYPAGPLTDPVGPRSARERTLRGCNRGDSAQDCRSATRFLIDTGIRNHRDNGLRPARTR